MLFSGAWGKMIHEKPEAKCRVTLSLYIKLCLRKIINITFSRILVYVKFSSVKKHISMKTSVTIEQLPQKYYCSL
jgi:hypothetical protein